MEPFPPPDSIGRDGLFLGVLSGLYAWAVRVVHYRVYQAVSDEGRGVARVRPVAGGGAAPAGGARLGGRGGSGVGVRGRAARGWGGRLDAGGVGVCDGGRPRLSGALGGGGAGVRGAPLVPVRAGAIGVSGDTVGRGGFEEGRDAGGRGDLRRPGARPPAADGARVAPRVVPRGAQRGVRQEPAGREARGGGGGGGECGGPRGPRGGRREGRADAGSGLAGLRLSGKRDRPG